MPADEPPFICPTCNGDGGTITRRGDVLSHDECPDCDGTGRRIKPPSDSRHRPSNHAADGWLGPDVVMDPDPTIEPPFDSECECCGHRGPVTLCQDQYDNAVVLCAPCIGLLTDAADE